MGVVSSPYLVSRAALCGALLLAVGHAQANETITYTYDPRGQVIAVDRTGTVNNGQAVDVTYDKAGNRSNYTSGGAVTEAELAIDDVTVVEGGDLVFTVTRSGLLTNSVTVDYATSDDTAVAGTDYITASNTVSFAANETTKTITVATIDDGDIEAAKTLTVTLSNPTSGATLVTGTGTGTINDNDTPPEMSVANAVITEGGSLSFPVSLTYASPNTVSVNYATSDGTAVAGDDYTATSGSITFDPGETSKTISVSTIDDSVAESAEALNLTLSSPNGATLANAASIGTINDNETVTWFSINNLSQSEAYPQQKLTFTVTRSGVTSTTASVEYHTADGTAISGAGNDYAAKSGVLTFYPGQTSKQIEVSYYNDKVPESNEAFSVILENASSGSGIASGTGVATILDDGDIGFTISDASVIEGGVLTFTITRNGPGQTGINMSYSTSNGSAIAGSDYTAKSSNVSFSPPDLSKTITVNTTNDSAAESDEDLLVTLSVSGHQSNNVYFVRDVGTGIIVDND